MKDRIILLIKAKNLTAAQFADEIGVQKSSISHIISGRNNTSLDFVQKVLLRYPEVNMEWLMFGKGPLFKSVEIASNGNDNGHLSTITPLSLPPVDLFSALVPDIGKEFRKETELSIDPKPAEIPKPDETTNAPVFPEKENREQVSDSAEVKPEQHIVSSDQKNTPTKVIVKIVEFYSDNTFREYFPE